MIGFDGEFHSLRGSKEKPRTADEVRALLKKGNADYMRLHKEPPRERALYGMQAAGIAAEAGSAPSSWRYEKQRPIAAILCCADSRASPDLVFQQDHGHLFVVRTAGNTLDDKTIANLAYALHYLIVPLVVVMGHEQCGAVEAAMSDGGSGSTPARYMPFVQPNLRAVASGSDPANKCHWETAARENIRLTAADIVRHPHLAVGGKPPVVDMVYYHFLSGQAEFFI